MGVGPFSSSSDTKVGGDKTANQNIVAGSLVQGQKNTTVGGDLFRIQGKGNTFNFTSTYQPPTTASGVLEAAVLAQANDSIAGVAQSLTPIPAGPTGPDKMTLVAIGIALLALGMLAFKR